MQTTDRAVDSSAWDGNRAMTACKTAADYNSICAGKKAGDPALRSSHALPHHYLGKGPNADGVRAALQRFSQTQGLTNATAAKAHLEAHMSEISPGSRADANDTVECPECGAMNNLDAVFCDQCGRSLSQTPTEDLPYAPDSSDTVRCSSCGKMNDPDAVFCDQCGAAMAVSPSAARSAGDEFRAIAPFQAVRDSEDGGPAILHGHFVPFNQWAEIDSEREGRFLEQVAPGATVDSLRHSPPLILFQHGRDPQLGDKVLTSNETFGEDERGAFYEGPLLDGVDPLLVAGLRAGKYGASFRFHVPPGGERVNRTPKRSEHNPEGLPERTITRMAVREVGPVTFPAYAGSTAGVRSMTDEFRPYDFNEELARRVEKDPSDLARMIKRMMPATEEKPREEKPPAVRRFRTREEYLLWMSQN